VTKFFDLKNERRKLMNRLAAMAAVATQTFLITGNTDGIGRHAILKLAKANHTVIIHGRCKFI